MIRSMTIRPMSDSPTFAQTRPEPGPLEVAPGIVRIIAPNPGPFTFTGTASYLIGRDTLAIVDPGPDDDAHLAALVAACEGRPVGQIITTHTHRDHVDLVGRLKALTGARTFGIAFSRRPGSDGTGGLDAAHDQTFRPDVTLTDGMALDLDGFSLETILTPGHAANHACFAVADRDIVLTGDHVMGWSTSVVAPPDGHMGDYMRSLARLADRDDALFLPGHGDVIERPQRYVRGLATHRRQREAKILDRLRAGDRLVPDIVARVYPDLDPRLVGAASLSTRAHLLHLAAQGLARPSGEDAWEPV